MSKNKNKQTLENLFFDLCESGNINGVRHCIELGLDVNCVSEDGMKSGLSLAAKYGYLQLLNFLLLCPDIDVNLTTDVRCIEEGNYTSGQITPLMVACYNENHKFVRSLLNAPNIDLEYQDSLGCTALHWAAAHSYKCLQEFLDEDVDVNWNCQDIGKRTPLTIAVLSGNSATTILILTVPGVDFDIKDGNELNVAQNAVMGNDNETEVSLHCLKVLVANERINFNVLDEDGNTPIMWTLKNQWMDRFNILVNCSRIDLNIQDRDGDSIALWALKNNNHGALKQLLTKPGLDVTLKDTFDDDLKTLAK